MTMRRVRDALAVSVCVLAAACSASGRAVTPAGSYDALAVAASRSFLDRYVGSDGRVVRHDQSGDTVSEGQGYAMLVAVAIDDRPGFDRVWNWTRQELQRPDGLLAYHWQDGRVADATPAADADLQVAWALTLAASRFRDSALTVAAKKLATATADHEISYDRLGRPVLAAGPWAVGKDGGKTTMEPGYWTFQAMQSLATLTADQRWATMADATRAHLLEITKDGAALPPDWAHYGDGMGSQPSASPTGDVPPQSGLDGLRAVVWASCWPELRPVAAKWWQLLGAKDPSQTASMPLSRSLAGTPTSSAQSPLAAVAAAAAARAAGARDISDRLLAAGDRLAASYPTYYGQAWMALGRLLLTTPRLPCNPR